MNPSEDLEIRPPRDETYYFAMLVVLVEGCLFKVPRYYFEESDVFQAMLKLPFGVQTGEGTTDEHPLRLDGVTANDFRTFLTVLIRFPSTRNVDKFTKDEWLAVLHLAAMWEFTLIRELSVGKLSAIGMTAAERISIARREDMPDWLVASHGYLIALDKFPSIRVVEELGGLQFCMKIAVARETVWRQRQQRNRHNRSWKWADDIPSWYSVAVELCDLPRCPIDQLNRNPNFIDEHTSYEVCAETPAIPTMTEPHF
ncbi:hypothetical protein BD410DRAFT_728845 [Rickenella mellea]|uniref:BTB domain-containing protein n=1 Tax=Rickenella mellea TaxID=50990 RepID=A0A4Y7PUG8_9AGAM|nr:hypothetical protein BD410DRAFT_728845 [Rickenella mellea]